MGTTATSAPSSSSTSFKSYDPDRPTSDWDARDCCRFSECRDGWSGPFVCCLGATFGCLEHFWVQYNRICVSFWTFALIATCIGMLIFFSAEYDYRIENPSEFHYTTCMIKEIYSFKADSDDKDYQNEITFVYGIENNDWNKEGKYELKQDDWNELKRDGTDERFVEGDIGTCVYSLDPNFHDEFTIQNYLIHEDTSAMWLILDNKIQLISWIIFFLFGCIFVSIGGAVWIGKMRCGFMEFVFGAMGAFAAFVLGI